MVPPVVFGAMGSNRANTFDLVVGRMANANGGEGPPGQEEGQHKLTTLLRRCCPYFD